LLRLHARREGAVASFAPVAAGRGNALVKPSTGEVRREGCSCRYPGQLLNVGGYSDVLDAGGGVAQARSAPKVGELAATATCACGVGNYVPTCNPEFFTVANSSPSSATIMGISSTYLAGLGCAVLGSQTTTLANMPREELVAARFKPLFIGNGCCSACAWNPYICAYDPCCDDPVCCGNRCLYNPNICSNNPACIPPPPPPPPPPPTVSISGPSAVPLRSGSDGVNWITLNATGNPPGGDYSWTTSSQKVSLSNSVTGPIVTVTSVFASSCTTAEAVTVTYTLNGGHAQATRNITVQQPSQVTMVPGTDSTTSEASCGSNPAACGVTRTFNYQVVDQCGGNISYGGMPFWDSITTGSPNNLNLQSYTTTCPNNAGPCGFSTQSNGTFPETLLVCAPACASSGACTSGSTLYTNATQVWNVNGFSTASKNLRYQCDQILVNGQ